MTALLLLLLLLLLLTMMYIPSQIIFVLPKIHTRNWMLLAVAPRCIFASCLRLQPEYLFSWLMVPGFLPLFAGFFAFRGVFPFFCCFTP
jgi:hypothetical protein